MSERQYAFTREQLISALVRIEVRPVAGKVVADWMADALIEVLEEECHTPEVRYVSSSDQAVSGDEIH